MPEQSKRYNIVSVPLLNLYVATDKQQRLRLSADIVKMYELAAGNRVELGFVADERAICLRQASGGNLEAANVDQRGYISARRFFAKSQIPAAAGRYVFEAEQDGWLIFVRAE